MYPVTCAGGYSVPVKSGKFEIVGVRATVSNTGLASQIVMYDDGGINQNSPFGRILPDAFDPGNSGTAKSVLLCNIKGIANLDATLEVLFPESIKTRNGTSVAAVTNIVPGTIQLYCR